MNSPNLVPLTRCPIDGSKLAFAEKHFIAWLNQSIAKGELRDRMDQKVTRELDAGLVNASKTWLYPIRAGIPSLLADEAVSLEW